MKWNINEPPTLCFVHPTCQKSHCRVAGLKFYSFVPWCHATFDLTCLLLSPPALPFTPRLHPLPASLSPFLPFLPLSSSPSLLSLSQAKVDNEIIDYRHLAAIPRVKAIYDIEHPDMISYKCVNGNSSTLDNRGNRQERQSPAEVTSCATMQAHTRWHLSVSLTWSPVVLVWLVAPHQTRIERHFWKQIIHLQAHRILPCCSFGAWMNIYLKLAFFFN